MSKFTAALIVLDLQVSKTDSVMTNLLFPFVTYWPFYLGFSLFIVFMLLLDLGLFHRKAHAVSIKEAGAWTVFWISLGLLFNFLLYHYLLHFPPLVGPGVDTEAIAAQVALDFLTGLIIEKSLSFDNIFVFVVVFSFFGIPAKYQHRILFYGILGALLFRGIFVALGSYLVTYHLVVLLFGALLIVTGIKVIFAPKGDPDPSKNPAIKLLKRYLPLSETFEDGRFFIRAHGSLMMTPLFLSLVVVEVSDIIFALDSVPAIFAITREPLIVFTSNVFAILGLRSMFFLLAGVVDKFYLIKYGLGTVLIFVGLKMVWLNDLFDGKFPIHWSLAIICVAISSSIAGSLLFPLKKP